MAGTSTKDTMPAIKVISKQNNIKKILARLPKGRVVAGLPSSSGSYESGKSVVSVGVANEYGVSKRQTYDGYKGTVTVSSIPERSFMGSTAKENRKQWTSDFKEMLPMLLEGSLKPKTALDSMGARMEKDIKQKIMDITEPGNSPQVIADKGFDNPLISSGRMVQAITHELRGA